MEKDHSKILHEFDFDFLKKHDVIINIAVAFGKILKNYKKGICLAQAQLIPE